MPQAATLSNAALLRPERASTSASIATPPASAVPATAWLANPNPRIDPQLNLLVLEFHDAAGRVTNTIPNARQLDAYRLHGVPGRSQAAANSIKPP